jgi:DNA-binding MarR family transcriptional regulator
MPKRYEDVLVALRSIMRASELYSRKLSRTAGLTTPQLLVLRAVAKRGDVPIGAIASELKLAQATVTTILDRLEQRQLVYRARSQADRRVVHVRLTPDGESALAEAPAFVQEDFAERFRDLPEWEQSMITASIQRVAELMEPQTEGTGASATDASAREEEAPELLPAARKPRSGDLSMPGRSA